MLEEARATMKASATQQTALEASASAACERANFARRQLPEIDARKKAAVSARVIAVSNQKAWKWRLYKRYSFDQMR